MNLIDGLGNRNSPDIEERYKNLPRILAEYESELAAVEADLKIAGKSLEIANRENASLQYFYQARLTELKTLVRFFEQEIARVRGRLFRNFSPPNFNIDLSDRAKDKYVDNEQAYLDVNEKYITVKELHDMYEGAVDAFRARGYALNNITKLRVAQLKDDLSD